VMTWDFMIPGHFLCARFVRFSGCARSMLARRSDVDGSAACQNGLIGLDQKPEALPVKSLPVKLGGASSAGTIPQPTRRPSAALPIVRPRLVQRTRSARRRPPSPVLSASPRASSA
jgi:hypothetical protein